MTTITDNPQGTLARDKLPAPDAPPARDAVPAQDTVTIPVSGLLDITDGKAFIRGAGYQRGPSDIHLSLTQVRQYGLRRGDQITGAVRPSRPGKTRERYAMLTQLDSVNGLDRQQAAQRPHFAELTPLHPQQRLRLETPAGPPTARNHRPDRPDRQGPARAHRGPAQARQDHGAAGDRRRGDRQTTPRFT